VDSDASDVSDAVFRRTKHRAASKRERRVTGRFARLLVRPLDVFRDFLLIQLKPTFSFLRVYSSPQLATPYFSAVRAVPCFVTPNPSSTDNQSVIINWAYSLLLLLLFIIIINDIYKAQTSPHSKCAKSTVAQ